MNKRMHDITGLIGNTPVVALQRIQEKYNSKANLFAKLESFNPSGSVKDRIAFAMITDALEKGIINEHTTLIEPTSGNTGIGLAACCAALGFSLIITMPETMSVERRSLIKAYGAEIVLTPGSLGMKGAIQKANELQASSDNAYILAQFDNLANPKMHYETTGPEIWKQMDEKVDVFVAGIGTGGTISGVGAYLKEKNPNVKVIAVEPADSPMLSLGKAGSHKIQGIGAGFIPATLQQGIYDDIITISNEEAFTFGKELMKVQGISAGISSGAALAAAIQVASNIAFENKNIVVLLPDGADRYLSTPLFQ